ncbi:glycosyltransferase family 4 protein [Herpetosiphon geysericola]|uniref:glycosyltransferase family 4 protein n=1 Tax=Herpetosiphon geysericola TaxID=70996 RepID=UPI0006C927FE|nr:glycosyltransferase family 4 protein [Herpetosiphon geysericola]
MKRIVLIAAGCEAHCVRLQPWRYLCEVAINLQLHGHMVTIVSTGTDRERTFYGVPILRVPSLTYHPKNQHLHAALASCEPDVVLWHLGKTSMLHGHYHYPGAINIGIFTSPIYQLTQLWQIGLSRLIKNYQLGAIHLAGSLIPTKAFQHRYRMQQLDHLVVQTETTKARLVDLGVPSHAMTVITPGIDADWFEEQNNDAAVREHVGFGPHDHVMVYFGSPAPLRGLHTLLDAFSRARQHNPSLRLLLLSRRHPRELQHADAQLGRLLAQPSIQPYVRIISGYLPSRTLIRHVALADSVALPFDLVPSDAPLSLLEAHALGKPVITTTIGCLPEFAAYGQHVLAEPAQPQSLHHAILNSSRQQYAAPSRPRMVRQWAEMGEQWHSFLG